LLKIPNGPNDFCIFHIPSWIVIETYHQDAAVPSMSGLDNQMKVFKIIMISG